MNDINFSYKSDIGKNKIDINLSYNLGNSSQVEDILDNFRHFLQLLGFAPFITEAILFDEILSEELLDEFTKEFEDEDRDADLKDDDMKDIIERNKQSANAIKAVGGKADRDTSKRDHEKLLSDEEYVKNFAVKINTDREFLLKVLRVYLKYFE